MAYARLDAELHGLVRGLGGHATARAVVDRLEGRTARHRFKLILNPGRLASSLEEHLAILRAVRDRDEAGAAHALRTHLSAVLKELADGRAEVGPRTWVLGAAVTPIVPRLEGILEMVQRRRQLSVSAAGRRRRRRSTGR
ncbi:FCD domain-containing protein [Streptomyces sp. KM273126]|uniref:FCD domain-containing protein n=1 Tax=Streptomyces sp. KM273126 TaxID=2545247 RepID=UPI0037DA323C